jgi:flagellar biosynthesis chaperone FliJ
MSFYKNNNGLTAYKNGFLIVDKTSNVQPRAEKKIFTEELQIQQHFIMTLKTLMKDHASRSKMAGL